MNTCPNTPPAQSHIGTIARFFHLGLVCMMLSVVSVASANAADRPGNDNTGNDNTGPLRVVVFGDSLTAGFQIAASDAFPAKLERALKAKGHDVEIANAGVSGDTTAAALGRLDWAVPDGTELVIVELGANDMLRGLNPAEARTNLDAVVARIKAKGATVLLAGMRSVGNWGADYVKRFDSIFPELAAKHGLLLYPFFMEGVIGRADLSLSDGMHPNPRGVDAIVNGILPTVEPLIAKLKAARTKAPPG